MSKTLGNVIDPIDTIKEFGTDALRFSIALGTAGQVCFVRILSNRCIDSTCQHSLLAYICYLSN
jgi:isoleucyl-tRNA synthetase